MFAPSSRLFRLITFGTLLLITVGFAFAAPNEASGRVSSVSDGATFMVEGFGKVHLADVEVPSVTTANGVHSKEYTLENLLNVQVFLDIDDVSGYHPNGVTQAVVYLANQDGTPNMNGLYNRMIVRAGYGTVKDDANNEFDPSMW